MRNSPGADHTRVPGVPRRVYRHRRETRQLILLALLESDLSGIRVGEIAEKTHLTRPSVSHHLKILKQANIVAMRRDGTKNYYYLSADETQWKEIAGLVNLICESVRHITQPQGEKL